MPRVARWALPILSLFALFRCGGDAFTSSGGTGGRVGSSGAGGENEAGTNAGGGEAGDTQTSGGSGTGGSATGGSSPGGGANKGGSAGSTSCACKASEYCRGGECLSCADYSALDFSAPEALAIQGTSGPLRFPRLGTQRSLLYVGGNPPGIWASSSLEGTGTRISPASGPPEMSPLLLPAGGLFGGNLVFDRAGPEGIAVMLADFDGTAYSQAVAAPPPINASASNNSGLAAAEDAGRLWWTSNRFGGPRLVTAAADAGADEVAELAFRMPAAGGTDCAPLDGEGTAWVTADGRLLLFSHPALDASCNPLDGGAPDVYALLLGTNGQPAAARAVTISGANGPGIDTDPSLSPDSCELFFASDRGAPGMTALFRATRR